MPDAPKAVNLPFSTGNPTYDTIIAGVVAGAGGVITGSVVGWLNRSGFNDPNLNLYVFTGVTGTLGSIAAIVWRAIISKRNKVNNANTVIEAVATGHIPHEVQKVAVAASQISDEKIMAAVVNADKIKTEVSNETRP